MDGFGDFRKMDHSTPFPSPSPTRHLLSFFLPLIFPHSFCYEYLVYNKTSGTTFELSTI